VQKQPDRAPLRESAHSIGEAAAAALADEIAQLGRDEVLRMIASLEEQMAEASEALDFETAARLRDQAVSLRAKVESTDEEDALKRLKATARRGSVHGTRKNMGKRR
jgi:excinuclease ABC subunit B